MKKKQSTPQLYKNSYLSKINSAQNRSLENCQNTTNDSLSQLQKDVETSLVDTSYNDIYNKIKQEFDEMPQNQLKLIKNTFIKNLNEISVLSFQKDQKKNIQKKTEIQLENQLKSKPSNFLKVQSNSVSSRSPNTSIYTQDKQQLSQKNQLIDIQFLQEYEGEMEQNQKIKQEELEESYDYFTLDSLSIESNQSEEDEDNEDKYTNQKEQQKKQKLKKHKSHKFQQKDQKSVKKKVNKQNDFQFETISKEMAERKVCQIICQVLNKTQSDIKNILDCQLDLPVIRYLTSLEYIFNEARKNHKGQTTSFPEVQQNSNHLKNKYSQRSQNSQLKNLNYSLSESNFHSFQQNQKKNSNLNDYKNHLQHINLDDNNFKFKKIHQKSEDPKERLEQSYKKNFNLNNFKSLWLDKKVNLKNKIKENEINYKKPQLKPKKIIQEVFQTEKNNNNNNNISNSLIHISNQNFDTEQSNILNQNSQKSIHFQKNTINRTNNQQNIQNSIQNKVLNSYLQRQILPQLRSYISQTSQQNNQSKQTQIQTQIPNTQQNLKLPKIKSSNNSPAKTIKVLKQTQNNQNIFIYELNKNPNTNTNTNTKQQKQKHLQQLKKINYQKHLQQKENEKNQKKSVIQIFIDLITDKFMKKDNLQLTPQQEFLLSSQVGMLALHQNLTKSLQGSVSLKKFPSDKPFYSIPYQESEEIQNLRKTKRNLQNDNRLQDIYHGKIKHLNKIVSIENPDNYIRDLSENQHPVKVFIKNLKN